MIEKVNLKGNADSIKELFKYLKVGHLNDHMLNIVVAENRVLDFHVHPDSDEMFYIIEGTMEVEFDEGLVPLAKASLLLCRKASATVRYVQP